MVTTMPKFYRIINPLLSCPLGQLFFVSYYTPFVAISKTLVFNSEIFYAKFNCFFLTSFVLWVYNVVNEITNEYSKYTSKEGFLI